MAIGELFTILNISNAVSDLFQAKRVSLTEYFTQHWDGIATERALLASKTITFKQIGLFYKPPTGAFSRSFDLSPAETAEELLALEHSILPPLTDIAVTPRTTTTTTTTTSSSSSSTTTPTATTTTSTDSSSTTAISTESSSPAPDNSVEMKLTEVLDTLPPLHLHSIPSSQRRTASSRTRYP